ncbi:MAG: hypothetical protein WB992_12200 [Bryobacteraceae bacterium]
MAGALLLFLLSSCGLDYKRAESLVRKSDAFSLPKIAVFHYAGENGRNYIMSEQIDPFTYPVEARLEELKLLKAQYGSIFSTDELTKDSYKGARWPDIVYPQSLAGTGTAVAILARRDFLKITGINRKDDLARVEFQWKWKPTRLGQKFLPDTWITADSGLITDQLRRANALVDEDEVHTSMLSFRRFDSGWREDSDQSP